MKLPSGQDEEMYASRYDFSLLSVDLATGLGADENTGGEGGSRNSGGSMLGALGRAGGARGGTSRARPEGAEKAMVGTRLLGRTPAPMFRGWDWKL